MATDIKSSSTEELRLRNNLAQMHARYEMETRDQEHSHADQMQRMIENETKQMEDLKQDYEVRISQEAEALEQKLHDIRLANSERVSAEQLAGDKEVEKVKVANRQKFEEYRKNGEAQLDALKKQLQASADTLHAQAKKKEMQERKLANDV